MCLFVLAQDVGRDPATIGDFQALLASPVANGTGVVPVRRGGAGGGPTRASATTAHLACGADPGREIVPELGGILGRKVHLVVGTADRESNGLLSGATVDIVDQQDLTLLRHAWHLLSHERKDRLPRTVTLIERVDRRQAIFGIRSRVRGSCVCYRVCWA